MHTFNASHEESKVGRTMSFSLTWSSLSVLSQAMNSDLKYKNQKKEKKTKNEQKNSSLVICLGTECFSLNKERREKTIVDIFSDIDE